MALWASLWPGICSQRDILGDFRPGFKLKLHHKDLKIALDIGNDFGVPLLATSLVYQVYSALKIAGNGDYDHSSIITFIEGLADFQVSSHDG